MASVKIILKKRAKEIGEKGTLYLQIINSRSDRTELSLKVKIKPSEWNEKSQKIKPGYKGARELNIYIKNERIAYERLINDKLARGIPFTIKDIVIQRRGKPKAITKGSFISFFRDYIEKNPENLGYNTIQSYRVCLSKVIEYSPNLQFAQFNEVWVQKFEKYLIKKGQAVNTIADKMKVLKKIARITFEAGEIKTLPFKNYKSKTEPGKRAYLTKEEFKQLCNLEVTAKSHHWVKDTFIFGCLTGLRFSDLAVLTPVNIIKGDRNGSPVYRLDFRMLKTKELLSFNLPERAVEIIKKYGYPLSIPLLPILAQPPEKYETEAILKKAINKRNSYFNTTIKSLCKKAGVDKHISMHCSRHTFATLSLDLDIPVQVVSKMLGHKNLKETMIYAKIMDKQKDAAIDAWDNL